MKDTLDSILNPRSVALIGASRKPTSFSYTYLSIIKSSGYKGNLYPVNPRADSILGLKCYPSILEVPEEIDLAVVVTPRKIVAASVEECIKKRVKGIAILTGGFAEVDSEGKKLQEQLICQAREKGVRIIGPNCLGIYSASANFDGLLSGFIKKGSIAMIAQSGNVTRSLAFSGMNRTLGFSYIIDLGNRADIQFYEIIRYLRGNDATNVIALYLEGLNDGRKFIEEVRETTKVKPVIVLKSGRTEIARRFISSHTAALAGKDEIYEAAFRQSGAIRVESAIEFGSVVLALSKGKLPRGNKVGILSEGGGDCAITADACLNRNLAVPEFSPAKQKRLREIVPEIGQVRNPVDLAMWEKIPEIAEIMLDGDDVDGLIIVGGFAGWDFLNPNVKPEVEESARKMVELMSKTKKPILIYTYYSRQDSKSLNILRQNEVPLFMDHHDTVNTMAALVKYNALKSKMRGRSFPSTLKTSPNLERLGKEGIPKKIILGQQALEIVAKYGLPIPEYRVAQNQTETVQCAERIGYPVVLKIISEDILHKSDVGCVKLGLNDSSQVRDSFDEIMDNAQRFNKNARIRGVLVSRMDTEEGLEIIIGGLNDQTFGPTVMFGLGGIFVELLKDVSFGICPLDQKDAEEMIREIKGLPILTGIRGKRAVDLESIKKALGSISRLLLENPQISELDLNPIKVHQKGLSVLDVRMILK